MYNKANSNEENNDLRKKNIKMTLDYFKLGNYNISFI